MLPPLTLVLSSFHLVLAPVAQSAERVLGKDEVGGSNPLWGSRDVDECLTEL